MSLAPPDDALLAALSVPAATVPQVVERMRAIDAALPDDDGLKWFNVLYRMVTEGVAAAPAATAWADGPWLERLDVIFAGLYFEAIGLWLQDRPRCPRAWVALFEARRKPGVARLQFALAGMNAHINRDLAVALVRTCEASGAGPRRPSPQHDDYEQVNGLLESVESAAVVKLATGLVSEVANDLGRVDDVLAMWKIRAARDAAWTNAEVLWNLRALPPLATSYLATLDRMTGFAGRGMLMPLGLNA
jgi:hypothetical protein